MVRTRIMRIAVAIFPAVVISAAVPGAVAVRFATAETEVVGDEDDDAEDLTPEQRRDREQRDANARAEANARRRELARMVFRRYRDADEVREALEAQLDEKIKYLDRLCGLSDSQKKKLRLAGSGDIRRFLSRVDDLQRKVDDANRDAGALLAIERREIVELDTALRSGIFGKNSMLVRAIPATLSAGQSAVWPALSRIDALGGTIRRRPREAADEFLEIRLTATSVSDNDLALLSSLKHLQSLAIDATSISDGGLEHLSGFTRLEKLDLSFTRLDGGGLKHLAVLPSLEHLDLRGTNIHDENLAALQGLPKLRILHLEKTQVSETGLAEFRRRVNRPGLEVSWSPTSAASSVPSRLDEPKQVQRDAVAEPGPKRRFPIVRFEVPAEAPLLAARPAVVVLDDCDPDFRGNGPHGDGLRLLGESGEELWSLTGFNNCQTVGGVRGVAIDRSRERIYVRELVAKRLVAFTVTGLRLWQINDINASALGVDEKTGNVWCTGGPALNQGQTFVFDTDGNELASFPYCGIDVVCEPQSETIWLAGYEIIRQNQLGNILFRTRVNGWCCSSIAANPADGSVWIAERNHPDLASTNRLWLLAADGRVRREINTGSDDCFVVACEPKTGAAWTSGYNARLRRVPVDGEPEEPLSFKVWSISISPTSGSIWVATEQAAMKIDASGKVLARAPFHKPSQQSWLAAF